MNLAQANLIISKSADGKTNWQPVKPEDVPEWLKAPEVMAQLVAGNMAMKADEGDKGSDFYIADRFEPLQPGEIEALRIANREAMRDAKAEAH